MKQRIIPQEERQRRMAEALRCEPSPIVVRDRRELDKNLDRLEKIDAFISKRVMFMSLYLITDALKRFFASRALYYAARFGKIALAEKLIDTYGADINYRGGKVGHTPLHQALIGKRLGMAEYLLKKGAKIRPNKNGDTPTVWACAFGRPLAIPMFRKYGVDFNKPDVVWSLIPDILGWGRIKHYPLALAFLCRHPQTLQNLIDVGVDLNMPVIYTGLLHKRKTLWQALQNPKLFQRTYHPGCIEIVRQAVAHQNLDRDLNSSHSQERARS